MPYWNASICRINTQHLPACWQSNVRIWSKHIIADYQWNAVLNRIIVLVRDVHKPEIPSAIPCQGKIIKNIVNDKLLNVTVLGNGL